MYALFCVETGWTWEYVDEEMTLPRLDGFLKLWKVTPPLRAMLATIASALGWEQTGAAPAKKKDLGAYIEGFASAGLQVEKVKHG